MNKDILKGKLLEIRGGVKEKLDCTPRTGQNMLE